MKIIALGSVGLAWAVLSLTVKAEPGKIHLAQSPAVAPLPPPASPPSPVRIPPPPQPTRFLAPLNKYLFGSLGGRVMVRAIAESVAAADRTFQSIWEQAFALEEDSPQFSSQVQNLLQSLAPIQQQYRANGERWGELKTLEVSLKLHYLICQDRQTLEIARAGLARATATGDRSVTKQWFEILVRVYWALGEEKLAIETQEQMLDSLRNPKGDLSFDESVDLLNLGSLYARVGRRDEAIAAYIEAFESADRPPVERRFLDVYYAAALTFKQSAIEPLIAFYESSGNLKEVEYWIQQREQAERVHAQLNRASDLLWGRLIAEGSETIPPAQKKLMLEEALQIFRTFGYSWGESDALADLSAINLTLEDYTEAIAAGEAALEMAKILGDWRTPESLIQTLVQAYRAIGREDRAVVLQRDYEKFSAEQDEQRLSRPRFFYRFTEGTDYGMLTVLHDERRCLGKANASIKSSTGR